ncbi:MAG: head-tail adaptor protein [Pseudomonadota bacterium]
MTVLNRKLELETRQRTEDGAGGFSSTWVTLGTHWGAVEPLSGRLERGEAEARSRVAYRVTLRAVPTTSPARPMAGQRFRDGTRIFEIRSVRDSRDMRSLDCLVDEEVAS